MLKKIQKGPLAATGVAGLGLILAGSSASAETLDQVLARRGLTQQDLLAAAKT